MVTKLFDTLVLTQKVAHTTQGHSIRTHDDDDDDDDDDGGGGGVRTRRGGVSTERREVAHTRVSLAGGRLSLGDWDHQRNIWNIDTAWWVMY